MAGDEIDVEAPDDSICPVCRGTTYVGETISCETCLYWFHFECVGVSHSDDFVLREDVPYFCPTCKPKRTPKKVKNEVKLKLKISVGSKPETPKSDVKKRRGNCDVDEEKDEEAEWMDAVESGKDHLDAEMKNIKDPKLMTARQRAMVGKEEFEGHLSLDYGATFGSGRKKSDLDSHEALKRKAIRSAKRKEMEIEKREESKKKTVDRLLKKKESKVRLPPSNESKWLPSTDYIRYRLTRDGPLLSYPQGVEYPLKAASSIAAATKKLCSVCNSKPKLYNCSKTNRPLCSLACYKANMESTATNI